MSAPVIEVDGVKVRYGRAEALAGLSFAVSQGRCHALLGPNGAGKSTALKALLGMVPLEGGTVRLFGLDPRRAEAQVKSRLAYVPDAAAFYPWMTVQDALDYAASFRPRWSTELEASLVERFGLDRAAWARTLSKGQRTQLALIQAVAADVELLILDEPTSGLDPVARRQFVEAIISAYQDRSPENRTILLSTHLITEFEGVVDDFTMMREGREVLTSSADEARARYRRLRAWFEDSAPAALPMSTVVPPVFSGRMVEVVVSDDADAARSWLTAVGAQRVEASSLSLEEIFAVARPRPRLQAAL